MCDEWLAAYFIHPDYPDKILVPKRSLVPDSGRSQHAYSLLQYSMATPSLWPDPEAQLGRWISYAAHCQMQRTDFLKILRIPKDAYMEALTCFIEMFNLPTGVGLRSFSRPEAAVMQVKSPKTNSPGILMVKGEAAYPARYIFDYEMLAEGLKVRQDPTGNYVIGKVKNLQEFKELNPDINVEKISEGNEIYGANITLYRKSTYTLARYVAQVDAKARKLKNICQKRLEKYRKWNNQLNNQKQKQDPIDLLFRTSP